MANPQQKKKAQQPKPSTQDYREYVPEHFSMVSAQTGPKHDGKKHDSLMRDLKLNGMDPQPIRGNYGYDESAYLVPHRGTERDRRTVEMLAWKHDQDSVIHSSGGNHKLTFRQRHGEPARPDWTGEGLKVGNHKTHYSELPSGKRIQLLVRPPKDQVEKSAKWALPAEESLQKSFLQNDGATKTDVIAHLLSLATAPEHMKAWGAEHLAPMENDEKGVFELNGHTIKIRKLMPDLYSGWVEKDGQIVHKFERVTMPETLTQLASKLEMHGEPKAEPTPAPMEPPKEPEPDLAQVKEKLEKLRAMKAAAEDAVEVPKAELVEGMMNPEKECGACENAVEQCSCYTNLPKPHIEIDARSGKVTILFKSEWSPEDKENFIEDLKNRAGKILLRKNVERAKSVRDQIKKRLGK
jgi:hypothetical protein